MADSLDSIVKGAPPAGTTVTARDLKHGAPSASISGKPPADPLSSAPSSPSMIYLNLLILEASLRAQYLELRARRRHHSFFLALLTLWTAGFGYALFLAPREDGRGVGGSVYWVVETAEKVCFMGGAVTAVLVWATGIWDRGVRWPRRWFAVSNRGLRGFNCKLVVLKRHWWSEALSTLAWFLTYGLFSSNGSSYRYVEPAILREVDRELNLAAQGHPALPVVSEDEEKGGSSGGGHEEDVSPGGDYVKLLLLAKPFSPTFRENWELYRTEYWERENERRALIRAKLAERDRRLVRQHGGWLWWLPWRKAAVLARYAAGAPPAADPDRLHHHHHHPHPPHHPRHAAVVAEHRRTRSSSSVRRGSVSATPSSRSPTPSPEVDEQQQQQQQQQPGVVSRRPSTASNASDKRRKKLAAAGSGSVSKTQKRPAAAGEGRALTPEKPSPLVRQSSVASEAASGD